MKLARWHARYLAPLLFLLPSVRAQETPPVPETKEPDVIFVPTPADVVTEMLRMARVTKTDVLYDLGCGDGRIPVAAAKLHGCKAWGFDIDPERVQESVANIKKNGVGALVRVEKRDVFKLDLRPASVVTLYLLPELNVRLVPQLAKLRPGSRIVSHDFDMVGWRPEKILRMESREDGDEHAVFLWRIPLVPHPEEDDLEERDFKEACRPELAAKAPLNVVQDLVELAELKPEDLVADVGGLDLRVALEAARTARVRVLSTNPKPAENGTPGPTPPGPGEKRAASRRIEYAPLDLARPNLASATVIVLDLAPASVGQLRSHLARLRPGTRVLAYGPVLEDHVPDRTLCTFGQPDGSRHILYRFKTPLQAYGQERGR